MVAQTILKKVSQHDIEREWLILCIFLSIASVLISRRGAPQSIELQIQSDSPTKIPLQIVLNKPPETNKKTACKCSGVWTGLSEFNSYSTRHAHLKIF